ncbi:MULTISPECIES: hypothetical protein [unclassified Escherichia]|uniref:hypothetical protein n=1 Tax=unclassified Escherichia TaxID=2608889 RepID=UPI00102898DC|nr:MULTISPECIES: hypothetical protein [unclassified Escherichia]RZM90488.1 hypothetical protein D9742_01855 [Escherichia sp. E1V33]TBR63420.1 hypothetical protein D9735_17955 [Escherichia sp. E1S7]
MTLMEYERCRKYYQYVRYLTEHLDVAVDMEVVNSFCSPVQYVQLIHLKLDQCFDNLSQKRKAISEMKSYATLHIVSEKKFDWMKSNRRVACFSWFWIFSKPGLELKKLNLTNNNTAASNAIPSFFTEEMLGQYSSDIDFEALKKHQSKKLDENNVKPNDRTYINDARAPGTHEVNTISRSANGINFERLTPVYDSKESYVLSLMKEIDSFSCSVNEKIKIINELYHSWINVFNEFPLPFSWIDLDEDENIYWLWNYMYKSYVGCDVQPATSRQMKDFAIATFDCWTGWNAEQAGIMDVKDGDFTPGREMSRQEFLVRARNSWIQKRHRDKKSKDSSGIKLTAQSKKKLMSLHKATGIEPNVLLKSFIDEAWKKMTSDGKE